MIFQIPATVSKIQSMAHRSCRVQIDTHENLTDEQMSRLMALHEKYGHLCFLAEDRQIDTADLIDIPDLPIREEDTKSPAQKLRGVLYVMWEQNGKDGEFEVFYYKQMEKFINAVKEKLT